MKQREEKMLLENIKNDRKNELEKIREEGDCHYFTKLTIKNLELELEEIEKELSKEEK